MNLIWQGVKMIDQIHDWQMVSTNKLLGNPWNIEIRHDDIVICLI